MRAADSLPLWELGVGFLAFRADHYRGSDQYEEYYWPIPYFIYRGEKLSADTSFIEGKFFGGDRWSVKLSIAAGLPVNSNDNRARAGMSDVLPTLETGLLFDFKVWEPLDKGQKLVFRWPYRAVTATDLKKFEHIGFFSVPYFAYVLKGNKWTFNWDIDLSLAGMYGSRKYHSYFYGVANGFANSERPAYKAAGGYSGTQGTLIISRRFKHFSLLSFVRYDLLSNAVFEDSPLVKQKNYLMFGASIMWYFYQSDKKQRNDSLR